MPLLKWRSRSERVSTGHCDKFSGSWQRVFLGLRVAMVFGDAEFMEAMAPKTLVDHASHSPHHIPRRGAVGELEPLVCP